MAEISSNAVNPDEHFLFHENEIFISKLRFIADNQTYAMSGITSVKFETIRPSSALPLFLLIIGVIFGIVQAYTYAAIIIIVGFAVGFLRPDRYAVTLVTSGSEVRSYISKDKEFVGRIVKALNDAIILRG
jgi:hypothetical protein